MRKMRTLRIILTLATLATFTSCDCVQNVTGTVIDEQTEQPIQNAHVQKENKENDQADTDYKGNFEIMSISGGIFGCPPMTLLLVKKDTSQKH